MEIDLAGESCDGLWLLGEGSSVKEADLRSRDKALYI